MLLLCNSCKIGLEERDIKEEVVNFGDGTVYLRGWFQCPKCGVDYRVELEGTCKITYTSVERC